METKRQRVKPLPKGTRRNRNVSIRLTDSELDAVRTEAAKRGQSIGRYLLDLAVPQEARAS